MQIEISKTYTINTSAMGGHGLIEKFTSGFPASVGCEKQVTGDSYSQVFAVVRHPEHGPIAVTEKEFKSLGLPEVTGFPDDSERVRS